MEQEKIRVVICEDTNNEREKLIKLCREMEDKYQLKLGLKTYTSGNALVFDLGEPKNCNSIDILFLDIHLPGISGIEVAKEARRIGYIGVIIFVTKSKDYFEDAFDVKAINYLVKGERTNYRFESVFQQAIEAVKDVRQEVIVLSGLEGFKQIEIKDISYFEVANRIITVHYKKNKTFEFISTFQKLENQLFDRGFQRIHRAYLVSIYAIKNFSYQEVILKTGEVLPVGRKYYTALKEEMERLTL